MYRESGFSCHTDDGCVSLSHLTPGTLESGWLWVEVRRSNCSSGCAAPTQSSSSEKNRDSTAASTSSSLSNAMAFNHDLSDTHQF